LEEVILGELINRWFLILYFGGRELGKRSECIFVFVELDSILGGVIHVELLQPGVIFN